MIHVDKKPPPAIFDARVRLPGTKFLAKYPNPTTRLWNTHAYWRRVLPQLHDAYAGICTYSSHWIPYDTGADTVEHFLPKTPNPPEAYSWSNYRLVCATLNGRKGIEMVVDPFTIADGVFVIDFPSLLVKPADDVLDPLLTDALNTITLLGLNDEGTCWKARERYVKNYCEGDITYHFLELEAPFLAREILRANLVDKLNEVMGY